ncbi:MAG: hypothetical protein WC138_13640 [Methanoculleus sp.]
MSILEGNIRVSDVGIIIYGASQDETGSIGMPLEMDVDGVVGAGYIKGIFPGSEIVVFVGARGGKGIVRTCNPGYPV